MVSHLMRPRLFRATLVASLCTALAASSAQAQSLRGEVYDSLIARGPMPGARVLLDGHPQSAITDRRGRFVMHDVPEGTYLLTFYHPSLDSMRVSAPMYRVTVPSGGLQNLQLATPSYASTSRFLCGSALDSASTIVARAFRRGRSAARRRDGAGGVVGIEYRVRRGCAARRSGHDRGRRQPR